ncbi:hypothetical protein BGW39_005736 [Mortierella sp. 14UC]|nr:hypothetical protein BGW39_005736 [Mortierella sp. 14UC]
MRTSQKDPLTAKKKSLSIHIDTPLIGPHGMPLVHGSSLSHVGSIRGTVRFSSNYDCKGRDIQIIYEAWSETRWTASSICANTILPSSSTNPNCTIKYTIRAVLQRPFPSLSNVEACQEVWVVHSNGDGIPHSHSMIKHPATAPSPEPSSAVEEQALLDTDSATTTATTTPFMSTPASKIASDWSASSTSIASRKTVMTPMPSTPYGRNQLVVFLYYFCTIVLGLGFCKRYSEVITPSFAAGSSSSSSL